MSDQLVALREPFQKLNGRRLLGHTAIVINTDMKIYSPRRRGPDQLRRYQADYDHLADFSRPDTLTVVAQARRAIELLDEIAETDRGRMLFLLISLQTKL